MTGFAGFLMFRALRCGSITAVVFGTVFALAPFHFERVELGHAFVANYWGVAVLSCWCSSQVDNGRTPSRMGGCGADAEP